MRTLNTIKNILTGLLLQIITLLLGFISRSVFIKEIGIDMLGLNGLLTNILSMLGIVELGVGTAIYYSLYKPLSEKNYNQIRAIMNLYSKMYRIMGISVAILGMSMIPLLNGIIEIEATNQYVITVYLIFLLDSVMTYFLSYRRNILSADQKNYVVNKVSSISFVIMSLLQIIVMKVTKNYVLYILVKVIIGIVQNIYIYILTSKKYSYLKLKSTIELDSTIKKDIIKNTKALFLVQIAGYCVFGTDNILLSVFCGITIVGIYSNYTLIINTINGLVMQIFNGIKASFGNFLVEKSMEEAHSIFNILYFINFWITTFCSISLVTLLNPFIEIWIGKEIILSMWSVSIIVFNFYLRGMTQSIDLVRNSAGLYSPYPFFKYWALIEGILNLVVSLILAGPMGMGMYGIFLGTSISTFLNVFVLPWNVYKYVFNMPCKQYYIKYLRYILTSGMLAFITYNVAANLEVKSIFITFIIKCIVCLILPNILILLFFKNTDEFKYLLNKFRIKESFYKKLKILT